MMEIPGIPEGVKVLRWGTAEDRVGEFVGREFILIPSCKRDSPHFLSRAGSGLVVEVLPGFETIYRPITDTWELVRKYESPRAVTILVNNEHEEAFIRVAAERNKLQIAGWAVALVRAPDGGGVK